MNKNRVYTHLIYIAPKWLRASVVGGNRINAILCHKFCTKTEATFNTKPYKLHKLDSGPKTSSSITKKEALKLYKRLVLIRRLETISFELYKDKLIRGFLHLCSGQEAICVGMQSLLRPQDTVITAYRCHGWCICMGMTVQSLLDELCGRLSGCARGKGGSMHMYVTNFFGGNGIVGGQVPIGTGLALAHKYAKSGAVSVTAYGDGAANQGQVFESYNMAKLWELPCIYVCENNRYGMGTKSTRAAASTDFYTRGDYVPGVWVDGMDLFSVREATKFALDHCLSGKGPIVLEMDTYRYYGHSMSDPGKAYRERSEVEEVRKNRDPIVSFRTKIIEGGLVTEDEIKNIDTNVRKLVDEAAAKTKSAPVPPPEELTADIYKIHFENGSKVRGTTPKTPRKHFNTGHSFGAIEIKRKQ